MAARRGRAQPRTASSARLIVSLSVIVTLAAFYARMPGLAVLLAGVLLAAWMEPQPELTGSKGVPANAAEEARLARFGFWSDLRLGVFSPGALAPGWPVRASFLVAVVCAVAGYGLPVCTGWARIADAACGFLLVALVTEVRRRNANPEGDHPAVRVNRLPAVSRVVLAIGGAVTAGLAVAGFFLHPVLAGLAGHPARHVKGPVAQAEAWLAYRPEWVAWELWLSVAAVALLTGLAVLGRAWCDAALSDWRAVVAARAEWKPRWGQLKMDPAPQVTATRTLTHPSGATATDTEFQCPAHLGFTADFENLAPKLHPMTGQGTSVSVLPVRETGPEGPVPGSVHPSKFRVVVFTTPVPDVAEKGTDAGWAGLFLEAAVRQAAGKLGYTRPLLTSCEQLQEKTGTGDGARRGDEDAAGPVPAPGTAPDGGLIWATRWAFPGDEIPLRALARESGSLAATARTGAQVDATETDAVYFGALDDAPDELAAIIARRRTEDEWAARWGNVKSVQQQNPAYQHNTYRELDLAGGGVLCTVGFMTRQGQDPAHFRTASMEAALRPTMGASLGFLSSTAWSAGAKGGRDGERHHGAFRLSWSMSKVPATPADLRPCPADRYVLAGMVNKAFDAAKLPRPEVLAARALASGRSRSQLWEIRLRLFDGLTAGTVRSGLDRMQVTLGAEWLRAEDDGDGCVLYAGDPPGDVDLASPARDEARLTAVDWEQAWRNSGVKGVAGALPKLMGPVTVMPKNPNIKVLDYLLPDGIEISEVRDKRVRSKLGNQTGNGWVMIRSHPETVGAIRVLCAEQDPMPSSVPYDFDAEQAGKGIMFATGEDGDPISIDLSETPHLLCLGLTGPQPLDTRIPVPVSAKFSGGWATMGELAVGDEVFTATGTTTRVTEVHPVRNLPVYTLHLSDGQELRCGPDHLWKASTFISRMAHSGSQTARRDAFQDKRRALAASLRATAAGVPLGTWATLDQIVKRYGHQALREHAPKSISVPGFVPGRPACLYRMSDVISYLNSMATGSRAHPGSVKVGALWVGKATITDALSGAGDWLTARDIVDASLGRESSRAERMSVKQWTRTAAHKEGTALKRVDLYPVDEVLRLYADAIESNTTWRNGQPLETIVSAREMAANLTASNDGPNWAVRVAAAPDSPDVDLPVPPYLLGAWLGDGNSRTGSITVGHEDFDAMIGLLAAAWPGTRIVKHTRGQRNVVVSFPRRYAGQCQNGHDWSAASGHYCARCHAGEPGDGGRNKSLGHLLRAGSLLGNKHIPAVYLRASKTQRLALLQGLMDTDGTISPNGACELSLCDERLTDDALELIRSLGIKATVSSGPASITEDDPDSPGGKRRRATGTRWRIHFTTAENVFRLPRKAGRIPVSTRRTQDWLYVRDITATEQKVPMRCISIDDTEHLYLSEMFVPSHNSGKSAFAADLVYGLLAGGCEVIAVDPTKGAADFAWADDWLLFRAGMEPGQTQVEAERVAAATMQAVYAEGKRRIRAYQAEGKVKASEMTDPPKPIAVFFDEFAGVLDIEKRSNIGTQPLDDPRMEAARLERLETRELKMSMGLDVANIAAELRSAGIHLILVTQRLTAKLLEDMPKGQTLRTNMARIILGKASQGDKMSALRLPDMAPEHGERIPKGRGIYEPLDGPSMLMQGWFATPDVFAEQLRERLPVKDPAEKLDITPFLKKPDEDSQVGVARPAGDAAAEVPEEVELDAVEMSDSFWDDEGDSEPDDAVLAAGAEWAKAHCEPETGGGDAGLASPDGGNDAEEEDDEDGRRPEAPPLTGAGTLILAEPLGALCPLGNRDEMAEWPDWADAGGPYRAVSRTMLTRIDDLAGEDAELAWTRDPAGDANERLAPRIRAGRPLPVLPGPVSEVTGWVKLDALIAYLSAHPATTRVCWIDGDFHPGTGGVRDPGTASAVLTRLGIDALLVAADPGTGVTPGQVGEAEEWAATPAPELGASDPADEAEDDGDRRPQAAARKVLVCEVDGVIRGPFGGEVSGDLLQAVRDAEHAGALRLAWLTSWGDSANVGIGRELGGPREVIPVPGTESAYGEPKLDALEAWLAASPDVRHVIWADPVAAEPAESGFGTVGDAAARIARENGAELTVADLSTGMLTPEEIGALTDAAPPARG